MDRDSVLGVGCDLELVVIVAALPGTPRRDVTDIISVDYRVAFQRHVEVSKASPNWPQEQL